MVPECLSRLQHRFLAWLDQEEGRTRGMLSADHRTLVLAMDVDKGNLSPYLKGLERKSLIWMQRTPGVKAETIDLTPAGRTHAEVVNKERIGLCPR